MRCPHCGAKHQEDGFECTECHQMIRIEVKTTWKQVVIGGIVLIVLGLIAFSFIYMKSNNVGPLAEDEPASFNDYSWEELANISSEMTLAGNEEGALREAKKHDFVTDDGALRTDLVKEFELADGTKAEAQLVGIYHDPRSNNAGNAGMSFIVTVPVSESGMNAAATNAGGWEASELRAMLNGSFFESLPADLQNYILEVKKQTNNAGQTSSSDAVTITNDKLWSLSLVEVMGTSSGNEGHASVLDAEGSQYDLLADPAFKQDLVKKIADSSSLNWWLRSANPETATQFYSQGAGSDTEQNVPLSMEASDKLSVVIGFCI